MNDNTGAGFTSDPRQIPSTSLSYSIGWQRMKQFFLELLMISVIFVVLYLPLAWAEAMEGAESGFSFITQMFSLGYWVLIMGPVSYGCAYAYLKGARGERPSWSDVFKFQDNYVNCVLAHLLVSVVVGVGFMFLIIPGIVFACRFAFVEYLVMDRKMEAIEAFKESWNMTRGHSLSIFGIGLLAVPIAIAGLCMLGVGIIAAVMWVELAFASIYHHVSLRKGQPA